MFLYIGRPSQGCGFRERACNVRGLCNIYIEVKLTAGKREKVDDIPYTGEPEYNVVRDARFRSFRMLPFSMVGVQKDEVTIILFGNESREYWSYYV